MHEHMRVLAMVALTVHEPERVHGLAAMLQERDVDVIEPSGVECVEDAVTETVLAQLTNNPMLCEMLAMAKMRSLYDIDMLDVVYLPEEDG